MQLKQRFASFKSMSEKPQKVCFKSHSPSNSLSSVFCLCSTCRNICLLTSKLSFHPVESWSKMSTIASRSCEIELREWPNAPRRMPRICWCSERSSGVWSYRACVLWGFSVSTGQIYLYNTPAAWPQPRRNLLLSSVLEDFAYHIDMPWNQSK